MRQQDDWPLVLAFPPACLFDECLEPLAYVGRCRARERKQVGPDECNIWESQAAKGAVGRNALYDYYSKGFLFP
jgi:hypothetical protein